MVFAMTTAVEAKPVPVAEPRESAQRFLLHGDWQTYSDLLKAFDERRIFVTFDRGRIEIMSPSPRHERAAHRLSQIAICAATAFGQSYLALGSTTFRREDLKRGFEPDSCFYIRNRKAIADKDIIDLTVDPPPDLVIEVEMTSR